MFDWCDKRFDFLPLQIMEKSSSLLTLCAGNFFLFLVKMDMGPIFLYKFCHYACQYALFIMLVLEHILNCPIFG